MFSEALGRVLFVYRNSKIEVIFDWHFFRVMHILFANKLQSKWKKSSFGPYTGDRECSFCPWRDYVKTVKVTYMPRIENVGIVGL